MKNIKREGCVISGSNRLFRWLRGGVACTVIFALESGLADPSQALTAVGIRGQIVQADAHLNLAAGQVGLMAWRLVAPDDHSPKVGLLHFPNIDMGGVFARFTGTCAKRGELLTFGLGGNLRAVRHPRVGLQFSDIKVNGPFRWDEPNRLIEVTVPQSTECLVFAHFTHPQGVPLNAPSVNARADESLARALLLQKDVNAIADRSDALEKQMRDLRAELAELRERVNR